MDVREWGDKWDPNAWYETHKESIKLKWKLKKEYHKGLDNDPGMFEIQILKKLIFFLKYTIHKMWDLIMSNACSWQ